MPTSAINTQSSSQPYEQSAVGRQTTQALSQEDFLQLLSVQFQQQDPFNPTSDTEFMAQMAQFTALEQMSQLNREFSRFRTENEFSTGAGMIGKQVIVSDEAGNLYEGKVEAVEKAESGYMVQVGDYLYPLSAVQQLAPPPPEVPSDDSTDSSNQ